MWGRAAIGLVTGYILLAGLWVVGSGVIRDTDEIELLNAACDPTRELWRDLNQAFIPKYEQETGAKLSIRMSHGGSSSQARAVIDGLEADVVSLAMWPDTDAVCKRGLIDPDWVNSLPNRSLPYVSTIVFVVRKGNPKQVHDWPDLVRPGVEIITPNPKTSGNGKWSFLAAWGAVVWGGGSDAEAEEYVTQLYRRVPVLDTAARAATMTFSQKGIGDVHLTWENEAFLEVEEAGGALEIVYPPVSILAEPHVALVDAVVRRKGSRKAAESYLKFLYTPEAQDIIARHHHRPTDPLVWSRVKDRFADIPLHSPTTIEPTWAALLERFFTEGALFDRIFLKSRR